MTNRFTDGITLLKNRAASATLAVLGVLTLVGGYPVNGFAQSDKLSKFTFTIDTDIINACNNSEAVHITGVGDIIVHTRILQNGSIDAREFDRLHGDGIGALSGAQYKYDELGHIDQTIGPNPDGTPFTYIEHRTQRIIGLGGVPDQTITFDIQLVIDGDGNVTVDIDNFSLGCNP